MKAEDMINTYKNFIQMCVGRDINDNSDIQFLFRLYIENIEISKKLKSHKKETKK